MIHSKKSQDKLEYQHLPPILTTHLGDELLPKYEMPSESLEPQVAYEIIKDTLLDEGNARQNLATFCQTYMEPQAVQLMSECLEKNAIDKSEYPQTAELENRCVNMLAKLWNANKAEEFMGTSTVGSSEACMLGGVAMKFRWRNQAKENGLDIHGKTPNLVISSGYQVCWEKFCVYWDIELRTVPMDEAHMSLNMEKVMDYVDEYTIGIVGILGITYTGKCDDIKKLNDLVEQYNATTVYKVYIHVDAASGGMFVPFVHPDYTWDFSLNNVVSINTSGHKYGLVYPGIGWILWRDKSFLPEELVFQVSYLGGSIPTIAINFSRSASQILGQYYNFIRYGHKGYKEIHEKTRKIAMYIGKAVEETKIFDIYNDGDNLPIVCWKMKENIGKKWNLYDLADRVRMSGWQVPAYPLPMNLEKTIIQRVVVRADFSAQLAVLFVDDLKRAIEELDQAHLLVHGQLETEKGIHGFTH
ncbi:MAG: glutamate decarboxylase [Lachnospiraceae bacterium]